MSDHQQRAERIRRVFRNDLWVTAVPIALIVIAAFVFTMFFVKPAPPKTLVLAIAADEGGSRYYARRYGEILKRDGVTVQVRDTGGSLASLKALSEDGSGVDVALVQGGAAVSEQAPHVVSLGSMAYVPLWIFYRGQWIDDIAGLKGRRIAIGTGDSGTRALALKLLAAAGADKPPTQLVPLERDQAIDQLKKGQIDAAFLVAPAESPMIKKLAAAPDVQLLSVGRADAWVRLYPFLTRLVLPRGVFDLANDIPRGDAVLLAPTLNLLAREGLHPALAFLLLRAATEVHASSGLLDKAGEFPAAGETGFPVSAEAARYYKAGPPFLQRYLPFWAAVMVDRLWVMLLPIVAVAIPLGRMLPALYRWRVRSRVFRWYARLKRIELELDAHPSGPTLDDMLKRLEETELAVNRIPTPLAYAENLYFFREHVEVVRRRIARLQEDHRPKA